MNSRGFALLSTLWIVVAMSGLAVVVMLAGRIGLRLSENRVAHTRAAFAKDGCFALLEREYLATGVVQSLERTDLGRGVWCAAQVQDEASRFPIHLADRDMLLRTLGSDSLVDALLDWVDVDDEPRSAGAESSWYDERGRTPPRNGPIADIGELIFVRDFDAALVGQLSDVFTTGEDARLNPNTASVDVLRMLGWGELTIAGVGRIRASHAINDLAQLVGMFEALGDTLASRDIREMSRSLSFHSSRWTIDLVGGLDGSSVTARAKVTVSPTEDRLAIVGWEEM